MENRDMIGGFSYICPNCRAIVAVAFRGSKYVLETVLRPSWNESLKGRAVPIGRGLSFVPRESRKDLLLVAMMQLMAKREETGFKYAHGNQKAALCVDLSRDSYIGYILWSEDKHAIARQIYIMPTERLKGYATLIIKHWVKHCANPIARKFGVETPNAISRKMLVSLGYAKVRGDGLVGVKCFFVSDG